MEYDPTYDNFAKQPWARPNDGKLYHNCVNTDKDGPTREDVKAYIGELWENAGFSTRIRVTHAHEVAAALIMGGRDGVLMMESALLDEISQYTARREGGR